MPVGQAPYGKSIVRGGTILLVPPHWGKVRARTTADQHSAQQSFAQDTKGKHWQGCLPKHSTRL